MARHSPVSCRRRSGDRKTTAADLEADLDARCRARPGLRRLRASDGRHGGAPGRSRQGVSGDRDQLGVELWTVYVALGPCG